MLLEIIASVENCDSSYPTHSLRHTEAIKQHLTYLRRPELLSFILPASPHWAKPTNIIYHAGCPTRNVYITQKLASYVVRLVTNTNKYINKSINITASNSVLSTYKHLEKSQQKETHVVTTASQDGCTSATDDRTDWFTACC
jgi:hypothetical protein